jgi:hypothetical protein
MVKQYSGRCRGSNGEILSGVTVTVTYHIGPSSNPNSSLKQESKSTISDDKGYFKLQIDSGNNSSLRINITDNLPIVFTFTKPGLEARVIKNPRTSSTGEFNPEFNTYIDPQNGGSFRLEDQYESGKWLVTSLPQKTRDTLDQELNDLYEFIKTNPRNNVITILSSESKPTNRDLEPTLENGQPNPGYDKTLPERALAKKRANNLKEYIIKYLNSKSSSDTNLNFILPDIIINNPIIGSTLYEPSKGDKATDQKYKEEQWVSLQAELRTKKTGCLGNGIIIFDVTYEGEDHGCNSTVYKIYANGHPLKRDDGADFASLNNASPAGYYGAKDSLSPWDNAQTGYQFVTTYGVTKGRFKQLFEGDIFPTPTTPIPNNQKPYAGGAGGPRYNRFIITPEMFPQIKNPQDELIKFNIECVGIQIGNIKYKDPSWGYDCHVGAGNFYLYLLNPDSNGNLIVTYESGKLTGATPSKRNSNLYIFTFDPCTNTITDKNQSIFNNIPTSEPGKG